MRLIDKDALNEKMLTAEMGKVYKFCFPCKEMQQAIDEQPTIKVIYACDGKRCNACNNLCSIKLCEHTTEIEHARNFRKIRGSDVWCEEIPTTTWIGSYSPYQCEKCGFHVDSKTNYCPECGRKAVPSGGEDDAT